MKLFYRSEGSGSPLVIMHGFLGSSDNWVSIARQLGQRYQVLLLDLRNHGMSPHTDEFSYALMVQDVYDTMKAEGWESPIVVGHSMGGKVAMRFAQQYPEMLAKLVVADIAPRYYPVHHQPILQGLNAVPIATLSSRGEAEEALTPHIGDTSVRQFLLKNLYRKQGGGFAWRFNLPVLTQQIEAIGEAVPELPVFEKPCLFMRGDRSDYIRDSDHADIRSRFPDSKTITLKNAGHWLHAEQPQVFMEILGHFMEK